MFRKTLSIILVLVLGVSMAHATALTANRKTPALASDGKKVSLTVKNDEVIYAGSLVSVDSSGEAVSSTDASGDVVIGKALSYVDNSADGSSIEVERGVFRYVNNASQFTDANIGSLAYVLDDQTVTVAATTTYSVVAGKIIDVDSSGVWIDTREAGAAPALVGGTIDGTVIGGTTPAAGTFTTLTGTTADINGGAIDATVIGGATPAAGTFTTLIGTTIDGPVGSVTPAAGIFTEVTSDGKYAVVGPDAANGQMVLAASITATAQALQTNTFATAFGAAPIVTCTYTEDPGDVRPIFIGTVTASNFTCTVTADKNFAYTAIGNRP